ncbi:MAG TPA: rhodanese-like domain-containing protein [Nevskiaceae bacterium]|nr:rhodanese-like domain-containing protein [Nevskiaceae bacterium]
MQQLLDFFHHHLPLFLALAVVLTLLVANEVHGNLTGGPRLGPYEAVRLINDRDPLILDLRPAGDFKRGHLLGAQNFPMLKLAERADEISRDKSRPVIVYDALGSAHGAVDALRKAGYSAVYPLRGGINAWLGANLPVTAK